MNQEHPEQWLAFAVTERLTATERALLDQHLAVCLECALYVESAELLRAEGVRKSPDNQMDRWAVERAISQLNRRRYFARPWWFPTRWAWLPAVGLLLVTAAVSAKLWTREAIPSAEPDTRVAATTSRVRERRPPPIIAEAPPATPIPVKTNRDVDGANQSAPSRKRLGQQTAAALFDRARELGREGKLDAAVAIHLRLQQSYPETPEAVLSSALSGRLLLERGRAAAALAQFDRHLASGGAADEEALAGRAASLQQLGRQSEEIRAWRVLLERYPGSVYADRAKVRLRDLSAR